MQLKKIKGFQKILTLFSMTLTISGTKKIPFKHENTIPQKEMIAIFLKLNFNFISSGALREFVLLLKYLFSHKTF